MCIPRRHQRLLSPRSTIARRKKAWTRTIAATVSLAAISVFAFTSGISVAADHCLAVANDGSGTNTSIQAATDAAKPGDTILITGGTYHETVNVRSGGTADAYITFQNRPGEKVIIDGDEISTRNSIFTIKGRSFLKISGLTITRSGTYGMLGVNIQGISPTAE